MRKKPINKNLTSQWSLKKPLYLKKEDDRYTKHVKQLKKHGFSDAETWALYSCVAEFTLPRLIRFREIAGGYPMGLTEDKWNAILDEMIFAFDWSLHDEDDKYDQLTEEQRNAKWERYKKGMQLFGEWFRSMWW